MLPKTTWDENSLNNESFRNFRTSRFILHELRLKKRPTFLNWVFCRIPELPSKFGDVLPQTPPTDHCEAVSIVACEIHRLPKLKETIFTQMGFHYFWIVRNIVIVSFCKLKMENSKETSSIQKTLGKRKLYHLHWIFA